jgi:transcriptional regulator with XRE-family HTH domain
MYIKRLKEIREDKNLTQKEVANILKITQQQYSLYEKGTRNLPVDLLVKLSKLYKVSTDYILELSDDERNTYINKQTNITGNKKIGKITIN